MAPALPGTRAMSSTPAGGTRYPERLVLVATAVLCVFHYWVRADVVGVFSVARGWSPLTPGLLPPVLHFVGAGLLLGVLPVAAATLTSGRSLRELGLGIGRWRVGLLWVGVGLPLALLAGAVGSAAEPMRAVYPLDPGATTQPGQFIPYALVQLLYYGAWEVLFRGVLLFGLAGSLGAGPANATQTALSVLAHFGRAWSETLAALPAGLLFGWLTLRLRSIWYVAVIHWVVGVSCDWFILMR